MFSYNKINRTYVSKQYILWEGKMRKLKVVNKKRFSAFIIISLTIFFLLSGLLFVQIKSYGIKDNSHYNYHTVVKDESLWSIAKKYKAENTDIREYIYQLKKSNNMTNSSIIPGEQLVLPNEI